MPPTQEQLRNRELARQNLEAGRPQDLGIGNAISVDDLQTPQQLIQVPDTSLATDRRGTVDASLQGILDQFQQTLPEETAQTEIQKRILETTDVLGGRGARERELGAEAMLPEQQTELQGVINQLQGLAKEAQAIPLQIQQEFAGRGVTRGGIAPIQTARLRENAIKALGLAAIGQTLQGNISLAQASIQQALDAEFEPEERKLQILQQLLVFNRDALERRDRKRTDQLNILLGERNRILAEVKADKEDVFNISMIATQFGAPTNKVQEALATGSREEALAILSPFMQDPASQIQLRNALLDTKIKKLSIQKKQQEIEIFNRFGGLSPTEWLKQQKELAKEETAESERQNQAVVLGREISTNIIQVDAILNSKSLDVLVGGSIFNRGVLRQKGKIVTVIAAVAGLVKGVATAGLDTSIIDELTGSADDTMALINQLISKEFLDKLIAVKGQGATFGQLSDREGAALRSAANAIGAAGIEGEKEGVFTAIDMSEKGFREQIAIIRERLQFLHQKTTGDSFSRDENIILDDLFVDLDFNPAF